MSGIVAGYFPHIPFPRSAGPSARVPTREEEIHKRERPHSLPKKHDTSPEMGGVRGRILTYIRDTFEATGDGPMMSEIESHLGKENFLAYGHVCWLEAEGFIRPERGAGGRRRLQPTKKGMEA